MSLTLPITTPKPKKPSRSVMRLSMVRRLITERNQLKKPVYVGDTQGDFEACQKAEVPFIWAAYGFGRPDSNDYYAKIESFTELEELLQE